MRIKELGKTGSNSLIQKQNYKPEWCGSDRSRNPNIEIGDLK